MSYEAKVEQEIRIYQDVANVHDLPPICHYWSNKYLRPKLESLGFQNPDDLYIQYITKMARSNMQSTCNILSLGAGNCDTEARLAESLREAGISNFAFHCLDINPQMLARGQRLTGERNLSSHFTFIETDINGWDAQISYDIIIANQSLHHVVELELLFEKTHHCLRDSGFSSPTT